MNALGKFLRLPPAQRRLFFRAVWAVLFIRFILRFLPFSKLEAMLSKPRRRMGHPTETRLDWIAWAVKTASRRIPGRDTCLVKAAAARILCEREGYRTSFQIGVAKSENGAFKAHAWVKPDGSPPARAGESGYTPLLTFEDGP